MENHLLVLNNGNIEVLEKEDYTTGVAVPLTDCNLVQVPFLEELRNPQLSSELYGSLLWKNYIIEIPLYPGKSKNNNKNWVVDISEYRKKHELSWTLETALKVTEHVLIPNNIVSTSAKHDSLGGTETLSPQGILLGLTFSESSESARAADQMLKDYALEHVTGERYAVPGFPDAEIDINIVPTKGTYITITKDGKDKEYFFHLFTETDAHFIMSEIRKDNEYMVN